MATFLSSSSLPLPLHFSSNHYPHQTPPSFSISFPFSHPLRATITAISRKIKTLILASPASDSSFDGFEFNREAADKKSVLSDLIQEIEPLDVSLIQKDVSPTTLDAMKRTISGMLGLLPSDRFQVFIEAWWESLSKLLISSMMTGYTLRNAEYRLCLERNLDIHEKDREKQAQENSRNELQRTALESEKANQSFGKDTEFEKTMEDPSNIIDLQGLGEISPEAQQYILRLQSCLSSVTKVCNSILELPRNADKSYMVAEYDLLGCPIEASQRMQPYGMGGCFHRNPQTVETKSFVEREDVPFPMIVVFCSPVLFDNHVKYLLCHHVRIGCILTFSCLLKELHDVKRKSAALQMQQFVGEEKNDLLDYLRSLQPEKMLYASHKMISTIRCSGCMLRIKLVAELSEPTSPELKETIHSVVHGLLATLSPKMHSKTPPQSDNTSTGSLNIGGDCAELVENTSLHFQPLISLTRDYLARLLFWCMLLGHYLRGLEHRMELMELLSLTSHEENDACEDEQVA
ncbi:hypothetical protein POTOM_033156 [Populus tomentosa]|uniref:Uncharacterized protein n=1 Tax=Populus tomentosa TaxID=118781 RepID=A0A8X7Z7E3_POPTO|nr:hypothetical protein POTOM_033156 [Populus tomentosa]